MTSDSANGDGLPRAWHGLSEYLCRHLVALVIQRPHHKPVVWTGFLVSWRNYMILVTAGHIAADLAAASADPPMDCKVHLYGPRPMIGPHALATTFQRLPAVFHDEAWFDVGYVFLSPLEAEGLIASGCAPLVQGQVPVVPPSALRDVAVLGYPEEFVSYHEASHTLAVEQTFKARPVIVPIEALVPADDGADEDGFWGHHHLLYGRIGLVGHPNQPQSMRGMSGGPAIALWGDVRGGLHYAPIGIQARWNPVRRIAKIIPMRLLLEALDSALRRAAERAM